jgi:hypothetical protein
MYASWLRLAAAVGFVTGFCACAGSSHDSDRQAVENGASDAGPEIVKDGGAPGTGGIGGAQPSGADAMASPGSSDGAVGRTDGGASGGSDASLVDAAVGAGARDASSQGGDASVVTEAGVDAGQGAGCAGSTLALCDDFEKGALDTKLWKVMQSKGSATLDASRGARGSKASVHIHVDPGSDTMVGLIESATFPALKAKLFARAFIFIPGAMATSLFMGDRHSRLIYAQGATPSGEYALGIWNGGLIQNHYSKTDDSQDTKMLPPFDEWFCLEYELDSAGGNVKAYLNDVEITALRHSGWPASNIDTLMFGVDRYGSFPVAEDIWFDDLAVDSARIGCTR